MNVDEFFWIVLDNVNSHRYRDIEPGNCLEIENGEPEIEVGGKTIKTMPLSVCILSETECDKEFMTLYWKAKAAAERIGLEIIGFRRLYGKIRVEAVKIEDVWRKDAECVAEKIIVDSMKLDKFFEGFSASTYRNANVNINVKGGEEAKPMPLIVNVLDDDEDYNKFIRVLYNERHIYDQIEKAATKAGFEIVGFVIFLDKINLDVIRKEPTA